MNASIPLICHRWRECHLYIYIYEIDRSDQQYADEPENILFTKDLLPPSSCCPRKINPFGEFGDLIDLIQPEIVEIADHSRL